MTGIAALRQAVKEDPFDLTRRLILADALEEVGGVNDGHFQRTLVEFCRLVQQRVSERPVGSFQVGVEEFSVNARVYYAERNRRTGYLQHATVYCWVSRYHGEPEIGGRVRRGSWKGPAGPGRFWLTEGPGVWARHIRPYGLAYLR